jgi:integrase
VSYNIRFYAGQDSSGKKIMKRATYRSQPSMTERQIEFALKEFEVNFTKACETGYEPKGGNTRFSDFAERWLANANLREQTRLLYTSYLERINAQIGHIKLRKLQAQHLKELYQSLGKPGANKRNQDVGLSEQTIVHYHRLISTILGEAKRQLVVTCNVASEHMTAPRVYRNTPRYLDDAEARRVVDLAKAEPDIRKKTAILILLYSGIRRNELCGLCWQNIGQEGIISVRQQSLYLPRQGIVNARTKSDSSVRDVKVPEWIIGVINDYRAWYDDYKSKFAGEWVESGRLFIQAGGKPIFPTTINVWLNEFCEKNNFAKFTPHSLRHTFATLQITQGVDIKTLQARTGHSKAGTLTDIYAHEIQSANERASAALDMILTDF